MQRWKILALIPAAAMGIALPGTASATTTTTVTVNESSIAATQYPASLTAGDTHWYTEDTRPGGAIAFVTDYGAPTSLGSGSLQMTTDATDGAKAQLINHQFVGTPLSDITALSYWTYQAAGNTAAVADPSFQLQVNLAGNVDPTSDYTTLVFEPYWQGDPITNPTTATWQQWDMTTGKFWSSRTVDGLTAGAGGSAATNVTLAQVLALDPHAVVLGIGVNVGTYNRSYTVATDGITFGTAAGTTVFDFEHLVLPTDKDQCKDDGWETNFAPGQFQNQGDCVSFVASGGKTHPAG